MRIGLIGAGNMASALARGLGEPALVSDRAAAEGADAVVLCHKPAQLATVAEEIGHAARVVVSILGGTPIAAVEDAYPDRPVYRLMPSIAVEIRQGVVCYVPGSRAAEGPEDELRDLFGRLGTLIEVPEPLVDAATAVMSCTPAFYALVVEALVDAGVAHGLTPGMAATMAVESMAGTAAVLRERGHDTRALRARVTSPGGMTARGLAALERDGVRAAFEDAVAAAVEGPPR